MKIISVTQVKNESDIIESFIRYHINIFDEMIILDNGSADETVFIIHKLIDENLPLKLIKPGDFYHSQNIKLTSLINMAVNEYGADIVLPLDVDEFIISKNPINPRELIETLSQEHYYLVKWITYIPTPQDNYNIKFIPKRITHTRDENLEEFYKVIVPKDIVNMYDVKLSKGNHDLIFNNVDKSKLVKKNLDLNIAHFPLRSKQQCISKIANGWPNTVAVNVDNQPWSFHWKILFDEIKENNDITLEDLEYYSKNYALKEQLDNIEIKNNPMNLDFCKNTEIKYDFKYNYLRNILDNYVYFAQKLVSFKRKFNEIPIIDDNFVNRLINDFSIIKQSELFNKDWYIEKFNPNPNIDPIIHYILTWKENFYDPASFFSTEFYYNVHKDVAKAKMNPFVHYIKYGQKENRKIAPSNF